MRIFNKDTAVFWTLMGLLLAGGATAIFNAPPQKNCLAYKTEYAPPDPFMVMFGKVGLFLALSDTERSTCVKWKEKN